MLVLNGEQGTAKSTCTRLLRLLVDPNSVPLRTKPRSEQDLFISANNGHVLAFDNLSGLSAELSDALCRLAALQAPVDRFFDDVMVMTDDEQLRDNRLALLNALYGLFLRVADISRLQG